MSQLSKEQLGSAGAALSWSPGAGGVREGVREIHKTPDLGLRVLSNNRLVFGRSS